MISYLSEEEDGCSEADDETHEDEGDEGEEREEESAGEERDAEDGGWLVAAGVHQVHREGDREGEQPGQPHQHRDPAHRERIPSDRERGGEDLVDLGSKA